MLGPRREVRRTVERLRAALNNGDVGLFALELKMASSADTLTVIREQKLLVKSPSANRTAFAAVLRKAAEDTLCSEEALRYSRYLEFIELWDHSHRAAVERLRRILDAMPKITIGQLLEVFEKAVNRLLNDLPSRPSAHNVSVAEYEKSLHQLNGLANDTLYAAVRALNEVSRKVLHPIERPLSYGKRDLYHRQFMKAIQIASELNGLEWVLDWVTYGDLIVSEVKSGPEPQVRLDHADARRSLLLELAIRRNFILNQHRAYQSPRYVRRMLEASETSVVEAAVEHYAALAGIDAIEVNMKVLRAQSAQVLSFVDAEDDILALASATTGDTRCATYYLAAMCLQWHELCAAAVRKKLPPGRRRILAAPELPRQSIEGAIVRGGGVSAAEAIRDLAVELPARSHFDIVRRPFLRLPDDEIRCLPVASGSVWNKTVREGLIIGGALGDWYGKIWETFFAQSFEKSGWHIVGRNLTLRAAGRTTTELDLMLKRNELLLVVELKALIGSKLTCYDHWRNRLTIEWGCRQAAAAADFIRQQSGWLASVTGSATAEAVQHIQPLVPTNLDTFDGWLFEGVPVIGEVGRKAITQGAKIDYTDSRSGSVVSTRWIVKPDELSNERIVWLLNNPIELLIAPEGMDVRHRAVTAPGLTILLPEFIDREDRHSFPALVAGDSNERP